MIDMLIVFVEKFMQEFLNVFIDIFSPGIANESDPDPAQVFEGFADEVANFNLANTIETAPYQNFSGIVINDCIDIIAPVIPRSKLANIHMPDLIDPFRPQWGVGRLFVIPFLRLRLYQFCVFVIGRS